MSMFVESIKFFYKFFEIFKFFEGRPYNWTVGYFHEVSELEQIKNKKCK